MKEVEIEMTMSNIRISEKLSELRRNRKITQEQLAEFMGVTKASVSKWETGQSLPDISLLPLLASFFDVSIDELVGYNPQLSKEQIRKMYETFSDDFSVTSFEKVFQEVKQQVNKYYSCYRFLFQMAVLLLNHYRMCASKEQQRETLEYICHLCEHIQDECHDLTICSDARILNAMVYLELGNPDRTIELLEDNVRPYRLDTQTSGIASSAYMMSGNTGKADSFIQISIYNELLSLLNNSSIHMLIHAQNLSACEETIRRMGILISAYALDKLHPNSVAAFEYQAALCYATNHVKDKALEHLGRFLDCVNQLLNVDNMELHGDDYFNNIQVWFDETAWQTPSPRSRKTVVDDLKGYLEHPAFTILQGEREFEVLKKRIKEIK